MASFLSARPWQFLGAISHSLYLFHSSIGWRVVGTPDVLLHLDPPPLAILGVSHCHHLGDSLLVGRLADLGAAVPRLEAGRKVDEPRRARVRSAYEAVLAP